MKTLITALLLTAWIHSAIPSGDTVTNSIGMKFKRIPAGTFQMGFEGRPLSGTLFLKEHQALGLYNEYPPHKVTLSRDFYMGIYEVTNTQFKRFRPNHSVDIPWYSGDSSYPVYKMTWYGADSFCQWLTANDPNGWTYRLPTEAEWEYCCRAGTSTWFNTGDSISYSDANVKLSWGASFQFHNVGSYAPNPWGLYDMHGNIKEWCLDWLGEYRPDSVVNPGGPSSGDLKCLRSLRDYGIFVRTVARGGLPPISRIEDIVGLRVVISPLTKDSLQYHAPLTVLQPYQQRVSAGRPAPLTAVSGETYADGEGFSFKRVRMTLTHYPAQYDSVIYVSNTSIPADSGATRQLAGQYARNLSLKYGVLYRISNRYELYHSGQVAARGQYYLTIVPDVKFSSTGWGHPDVSYYRWRILPVVDTTWHVGGPFYWNVNHVPNMSDCPNGDLLMTWYSGTTEDDAEQTAACSRLRCGEDQWDTAASLISDFPGYMDWAGFYYDGKDRVYHQYRDWAWLRTGFYRYSEDNGLTWSPWSVGELTLSITVIPSNFANIHLSTDAPGRSNKTFIAADDSLIRMYVRSNAPGGVANSDSIITMAQYLSTDYGQTWTPSPTPFKPPGIGVADVAIKLHSGRFIMATVNLSGIALIAESEDQGKTWFCRRKFGLTKGVDFMGHHKAMVQTKDGLIHLTSTYGSGTGNGDNPQISFSEQWLREGTCLDISEWGINTAGMVAAGCPDEDAMPPLGVNGAAYRVGANNYSPLQLTIASNPFNPVCPVFFSLPVAGNTRVDVFDISGRYVRTLIQGHLEAGAHRTSWNAAGMATGVYILRLSAGASVLTEKIVLAR